MHIEEEQTTQWPKQKVQKDKQRSLGCSFFIVLTFIYLQSEIAVKYIKVYANGRKKKIEKQM